MATEQVPVPGDRPESLNHGGREATAENTTGDGEISVEEVIARGQLQQDQSTSDVSKNLPPDVEQIMVMVERLNLSKKDAADFVRERLAVRDKTMQKKKQSDADMEKEIMRLNKELERREQQLNASSNPKNSANSIPNQRSNPLSHLKLPVFDEKSTDIESYIFRFEKHAELCAWPKDIWSQALASRLTGEALDVFRDLSIEKASTYDDLKNALFTHFHFTEDGFRENFRECKPKLGENFSSFTDRMKRHFVRWQNSAKIEKDYEKLSDLMQREHVYAVCSKELVAFLKQEGCKNMAEVTEKAERYRLAHPNKNLNTKSSAHENLFHTGAVQTKYDQGRDRHEKRSAKKDDDNNASNSKVRERACWTCGATDHLQRSCKKKKKEDEKKNEAKLCIPIGPCEICGSDTKLVRNCDHEITKVSSAINVNKGLTTCEGKVNGQRVEILLDTGCSTVGVHKKFVNEDQYTNKMRRCIAFGGEILSYPIAKLPLESPYYTGEVEVCVLECPSYDVILGKFDGCSLQVAEHFVNAVTTRRQAQDDKKSTKPLRVADTPLLVDRNELIRLQKEDQNLDVERQRASSGETFQKPRASVHFEVRDDVLMRVHTHKETKEESTQIVVPTVLRNSVLKIAHDSIMAGHMGNNSTRKRLMQHFYWRGFSKDVCDYCRSCDACQKVSPKGKVQIAPLEEMPAIETPFERVGIDLVGPFVSSDRKHKYILTCVDFATRYPEAIPLQKIDTEAVAEALLSIFTRVGLPKEILSDNGTQLSSDLMKEVMRLLHIKQLHTTIYHAQCNGLVERFHSTLKSMLRKMTEERPRDWDRYLPALLFSYREIPQTSTGFSPFELLYGRTPRGPLALVKDSWTSDKPGETVSEYQYVLELKERITKTCKIAQENVQKAAASYKAYKDKKAKERTFEEGDEVLVLLPTDANKLLLKWQGPFEVTKKVNKVDYVVKTNRGEKLLHVNMFKKYHRRAERVDKLEMAAACVIADEEMDDEEDIQRVKIQSLPMTSEENFEDVKYGPELEKTQRVELEEVFEQFQDVLTDNPGKTSFIQHEINLTSDVPVQKKQYPVPFSALPIVDKEVEYMLKMGVIEKSTSAYSQPYVLVKKKCGQTRFCIDFRALNKLTISDAEPIPEFEEMLTQIEGCKFFTQIDLAKGYWQIEVKPEHRHLTAFRTNKGLFHFVRMPFGLVTAPHSFARLMKLLRLEECNAVHYFDNVLIATKTWQEHVESVKEVFKRLREFGLTARPTKVEAGFTELEFLGHFISKGKLKPTKEKVSKILKLECPKTKKQVRSIIGLISFYRRYVPHLSGVISPLIEHTKKNKPMKVSWNQESQKALEKVQKILSSEPVLLIPNIARPFTIRTDASNAGLGAVLLQEHAEHPGEFHPVAYASRKLLDREKNYAIVEKECLAVVWGIDKFTRFLFGRTFNLETDHMSLKYLQESKMNNSRLMRWSLALQEYRFNIVPIAGRTNVEADALSRCPIG